MIHGVADECGAVEEDEATAAIAVVVVAVDTSNPHTTEMSSTISAEASTGVLYLLASDVPEASPQCRRYSCRREKSSGPSSRV